MSSRSLSLLQAVTSGDEDAVKAFLSEGADVNATNDGGQTPLILAIVAGHDHLLRLLLDAGANPLLRDHTQLSAVDWAERKGRNEIRQLLIGDSQSGFSTTRPPAEKLPSPDERRPERSLSADEKSRRWLAGLKQRLDEKARREKSQPVSPQTNQSNAEMSESSSPVTPEEVMIPQVATPSVLPQTNTEITPAAAQEIPLVSTSSIKKSSSRKRCPKCNTIYNSELLAYCVYHVVPLVDADEPVVAPKENNAAPLIWILVAVTLSLAAFVGVYLSGYLYKNNEITTSASPPPNSRKGLPVLGSTLAGKAVNLPEAEVPVQTSQQAATITVRVKIDKGGRVVSASSAGGDRVFREAAIEAAKRSTFSVEKLGGRGAEGTITYTFNL